PSLANQMSVIAFFLSRYTVSLLPVFQSSLYASLGYLKESAYSIKPRPTPSRVNRMRVIWPNSDADPDVHVLPPSDVLSVYERCGVSRRLSASSGSSHVGNIEDQRTIG